MKNTLDARAATERKVATITKAVERRQALQEMINCKAGLMHWKKRSPEIRERIVRVETKLDGIEKNMATKTDLGELRVSMAELKTCVIEGFNNQTKWFVATAVVLAGIAFTTARLML